MIFGWYEGQITGARLWVARIGTVAGLLGMLCLVIVAVIAVIGMFAA